MSYKSYISLFCLLIGCLTLTAQRKREIEGAWSGWIKTTDRKIKYEVVISDSAGKYSGYSKIIFNVKGEEQSAIKSLIITQDENDPEKYFLEEDKLIRDNFEADAPKKIKQVNTVLFTRQNKKLVLEGTFKTKATMGIRAATGDVYLEKNALPDSSLLFAELGQMEMQRDLSFVKNPIPPPPVVVVDTPVAKADPPPVVIKDSVVQTKPVVVKAPVVVKRDPAVVKTPTKTVQTPAKTQTNPPVQTTPPVSNPPVVQTKTIKNKVDAPSGSASNLSKRSIETIQTIYFKSDSLKLTLYDNGEVDGDTVSVVVNGKVFMGKKGLSTQPISETYYITEETGDSIQMIMYAENLGNIAPNTGLLIVLDGKDRYEVRFSGDLNKNAAIIFKREKE